MLDQEAVHRLVATTAFASAIPICTYCRSHGWVLEVGELNRRENGDSGYG